MTTVTTISLGVKNFVESALGSGWDYVTLLGVASLDSAKDKKSTKSTKTAFITILDDSPESYHVNQTPALREYKFIVWLTDSSDMETHQLTLKNAFDSKQETMFTVTGSGNFGLMDVGGEHIHDDTYSYYQQNITVLGN